MVGNTPDGFTVGAAGDSVEVLDRVLGVSLVKTDEGSQALAGAEFTLEPMEGTFADGTAERTVTVGEDVTAALEGLVAGETYTLTETVAPEGYELIEGDFAFTVALDGTVSGEATSAAGLLGQRSAGYYVADDGLAVIAVDEPTPLLDRLTSTGDLLPMAGYLLASGALLIVAGELRRRRKAR